MLLHSLFAFFCRSFPVTPSGSQRLRRSICTSGRRQTRRTRRASTWTRCGRERGSMWRRKSWSTLRSKELSAEISSCVCCLSLLTQLSVGGVFYVQQMQDFSWTLFFDTIFLMCFVCGLCFNKLKPFPTFVQRREFIYWNKIEAIFTAMGLSF